MDETVNDIAKNIIFTYNEHDSLLIGDEPVDSAYITSFNILQEMRRSDIEIYHYHDSSPCNVTLHQHDFYELYCVLDGHMHYRVEGARYALSPGSLLLIAPGEMHRPEIDGPPREFERIVLWLNPKFVASLSAILPQVLRAFKESLPGWNLIEPDEKTYQILLHLLYALLYERQRDGDDSLYLCHLTVSQLLIYLSRLLSQRAAMPDQTGARYLETVKVYEYINSHFREPISVGDLAEQFYMDKNTLTRQFKRIVGLTPGEYIRRKRLETAYTLIRQGAPIQEAVYRCGFTDYSAFYRAFRQFYGLSPREYAMEMRQGSRQSPHQINGGNGHANP